MNDNQNSNSSSTDLTVNTDGNQAATPSWLAPVPTQSEASTADANANQNSSAAVDFGLSSTQAAPIQPPQANDEDINSFIVPLASEASSQPVLPPASETTSEAVASEATIGTQDPILQVETSPDTVIEPTYAAFGSTNSVPEPVAAWQEPAVFTEATPIIPSENNTEPVVDIMGETAPASDFDSQPTTITPWGLDNSSTNSNVPENPSDVTPEMMADFLSQNQLETGVLAGATVAAAAPNAETTATTTQTAKAEKPKKKSGGSWIPVIVLLVMIFVVVFVIYLLLNSPSYQGSLHSNNQTTSENTNTDTESSQTSSSEGTETGESTTSNTQTPTSEPTQSQTATVTSTQSSAFSFTPVVPAGWLSFTDGFMGMSFALPPQDGYVEARVNTTPQTVTQQIRDEWLAKQPEWFYAPSTLASFFGTEVNAKTLVLNRAPGRASGIGSICATTENYCHIDISLKISVLNFSNSIAELVAKIREANAGLAITTSVSGQVWGVNSILMSIDYGSSANPSKRNFSIIQIEDNIYVVERFTKSDNLLTEFTSVLNAIKIN